MDGMSGRFDEVVMRLVDAVAVFPAIIAAVLFVSLLGHSPAVVRKIDILDVSAVPAAGGDHPAGLDIPDSDHATGVAGHAGHP